MRAANLTLVILASLTALKAFAPPQSAWDAAAGQVREGNCAAAVQTLTSALASGPAPSAAPYLSLANCYAQMGRTADAEQALRRGLSAHAASPVLERALGELLMHANFESSEAGQLLEHSVRAAPRDPEARHYYAQWAYTNSRERICAAQEKAALLLPGLNDLALLQMNTLLAMCSARIEDATGARAAFRKANAINLRQKAYDPVAAWQYVQFLGRFGDEAEVQAIVGEILDHVPQFGPARLERAKHFDRTDNPDKAIEEARLVLQSAGNDLNVERAAHGILARSFSALGRTDDAAREQVWIESHPNPETPR